MMTYEFVKVCDKNEDIKDIILAMERFGKISVKGKWLQMFGIPVTRQDAVQEARKLGFSVNEEYSFESWH